jgi:hypothetical protein
MFGLHRMPNWTLVPELEYEMGQLDRLKDASRKLLIGLLEKSKSK